jgi:hypothetical protein
MFVVSIAQNELETVYMTDSTYCPWLSVSIFGENAKKTVGDINFKFHEGCREDHE